ncbi:hypothetical protein EBH_0048900 [Eimeria brunetti]|uniref:SAG family member n=1 Tax=Eimeria brunetti TaxID=51314 RepID=U6L672_9EIME|nr:hypothetical protein EBH_0048900 [Eimeria brunetti]
MISFYKTVTAVCLVGLCGLQSDAAALGTKYKFTVVNVADDAYVASNLARNGRLPVHISKVEKEDKLVTSLEEKVKGAEAIAGGTCDTVELKTELKDVFHQAFDCPTETGTPPDYLQLLQNALSEGLKAFQ